MENWHTKGNNSKGENEMKKILVVVLILVILSTSFATVAFAEPGDKDDKQEARDEKKADREQAKADREAKKEEWKAAFETNKLARQQIKEATKAEIQAQREITKQYKLELQALRQEIENLPEEERAAYADQLQEMRDQIKDAQGYILEIRADGVDAKLELSPSSVTPTSEEPSDDEVDEAVDLIDSFE